MATIGYARVSRDDQDLSMQIDALEKAGCDRIYKEAVTGALANRPQLDACLDYIRAGDTLVVWRLDRLGRRAAALVALLEGFRNEGIGFRSLTEGVDFTTPLGKMCLTMMAAVAEMERDILRERTIAGLAAAKARGRKGGRRPVMTPEKASAARKMLDSGEYTVKQVAQIIGVGRATVYDHLREKSA